jgi:hypothetical protein
VKREAEEDWVRPRGISSKSRTHQL